ncbi:TetR/AcrR family transcriptional regulator [Aminipila sp.]|jgi:AcrR family transcriptional regulator|uniref:TetR/AcrR family transcriptional regulator n=1 Tax=Aminipila sp. TaxID=2060095 RepID=UPI001D29E7E9|nr:TetR/AcrR family transcriptional regulator [Aminipila sp.]MBE6034244.1 TetR/AcrR family transcriptional regulator [Clostridiales bacterium]
MSRDYQLTHENLLLSAKKHFLENGYERANLRNICKDANVTNGAFYRHFKDKESLFGALVDPIVETVSDMYSESVSKHFELIHENQLKEIWRLSEDTIISIIEYVYDNFHIFKLLLTCADGTKYVSFIDDVVCMEVKQTIRLMQQLKAQGCSVNDLEEDEWHILIHSYYSSLSEIVMHNYSKTAALKYAHTLADFFSYGWQKILGI